jgi:CHASE1-domain containing sensor protein
MKELLVPIVVVGEFALIGLIIWMVARRLEQRAKLRAELQMKLLERFTTVRELEEFLQTDLGRRFLLSYSPPARSPFARVAVTAQIGTAISVLAVGLLLLGAVAGEREMMAIGTVVLSVGVALLAAAFLGHRLIKAWGIAGEPAGEVPSLPRAS